MSDKIAEGSLYFERLSEEHASFLTCFDNRETDLVDFLREDALKNQKIFISTTFVAFIGSPDRKLVGYITLLADSVRIRESEELELRFKDKGIGYSYLPALKIGRMAVDEKFQGKGIGKSIIQFAIGIVEKMNALVGCRFLTVDAKTGARGFYEKIGFKVLVEKPNSPSPMFLDFSDNQNKLK